MTNLEITILELKSEIRNLKKELSAIRKSMKHGPIFRDPPPTTSVELPINFVHK